MNEKELGLTAAQAAKFRVSGRGYDCGCRVFDEIPFVSLKEQAVAAVARDPRNLIRTAPSWVTVKVPKPGVDPNKKPEDLQPSDLQDVTELQEVEGILLRSYQTWTDFPALQWHRWYDWNFMVFPSPGFGYLRGGANTAPVIEEGKDKAAGFTQLAVRDFDGTGADTMEIEFDCGLFGSRFRDISSPQSFGPMFEEDWAWPGVGQYFWARGEWVYDCGHPTGDIKTGPNAGLTRTELHPCRALATARFEAFNFPENGDMFVPAVQFMFFATSLGGYTDEERPGSLPTQNIEFIVDLPKVAMHQGPFPVGHTPEFPHNTIQLPQLLKQVDFKPFKTAIAKTAAAGLSRSSDVEPIVEPIRRKDKPNEPPEQVKVTIPFAGSIPATDTFYGFILSLGWLDPDLSQARRVQKVKVTFESVRVGADDHDADTKGSGEWQVRAGVNGRWTQVRQENIEAGTVIPIQKSFEFFLSDDDAVAIASHGEETDKVHDVYKDRPDEGRRLAVPTTLKVPVPIIGPIIGRNTRPVLYFQDCIKGDLLLARKIVTAMEDDMQFTFGDESDPLGRIDPFHRTSVGDKENPLSITKVKGKVSLVQTALPSKEVGKSAELAENPNQVDYLLVYSIEAEPQVKDT